MAISSNGLAGLKTGVCTSTTRPSGPYEGQMIYETDTDMVAIWNGTAWRYVSATTATSGTVLQVVTGTTSTSLNSSTSTFATTGLTATITPKSTSSKILALVSQNGLLKQNVTGISLRLVRDSTVISDFAIEHNKTNTSLLIVTSASVSYLDSPSTTSATTYKTEYASALNIADVYVQFASAMSSITLMEIAG